VGIKRAVLFGTSSEWRDATPGVSYPLSVASRFISKAIALYEYKLVTIKSYSLLSGAPKSLRRVTYLQSVIAAVLLGRNPVLLTPSAQKSWTPA
jgi:hypothetical protein